MKGKPHTRVVAVPRVQNEPCVPDTPMEPTRLTVHAIMSPGRAAHLQRWADTTKGVRLEMDGRAIATIVVGYVMGLAGTALWYGGAYLLGHRDAGLPIEAIWVSTLCGGLAIYGRQRGQSAPVRVSIMVAGVLVALGLVLVGAAAVTPVSWDRGALNPAFDVLLASAVVTTLLILERRGARTDEGPPDPQMEPTRR